MRSRTAAAALTVLTTAVLLGGCAERQLVTRPDPAPTSATWLGVAVAAGLAAVVLGVLLTLPAWRMRGGSRLAVAVLSVHTGAVVLGGMVLAAVAVRSWQLIDRPFDAGPDQALLRISRADGDTGFFALMVLSVAVATGLVGALLAMAARWAATDDTVGRAIAAVVLGLLLLAGAAAGVMLGLGSDAWPYIALAAGTPLTAAAMLRCWPRSPTA